MTTIESIQQQQSKENSNDRPTNTVPWLALWSGTFGALAGSLGKLAFSNNGGAMTAPLSSINDVDNVDYYALGYNLLFRGICLLGMIGCNALAVGSFLKGMEESGSVKGTALTTAANCVVSALLGIFVWQDNHQLWTSENGSDDIWWSPQHQQLLGLGLVLLGILVLVLPMSASSSSISNERAKLD